MGPGGFPRPLASCACRGPWASPVQAGTEDRPSPVPGGEVRTWTRRQEPGHCSPPLHGRPEAAGLGSSLDPARTPRQLGGHEEVWAEVEQAFAGMYRLQPPRGPLWVLPSLGGGWEQRGKGRAGPSWERRCPPTRPQPLPACPGLPATHPTQRWSIPRATAAQPGRGEPGQGGPGDHGLAAQGTLLSVHAPGSPKAGRRLPRQGELLGGSGAQRGCGRGKALGSFVGHSVHSLVNDNFGEGVIG